MSVFANVLAVFLYNIPGKSLQLLCDHSAMATCIPVRAEARDFKCDANHFSVVSRSPYEMSSCLVTDLHHGNMKGGYGISDCDPAFGIC